MKNLGINSKRVSKVMVGISFLCAIALFSCKKDSDNVTVLLNQSGTVTVKVTDDNQNGFKGAKVSIYSSIPEGERIYFDSTDSKGICTVGKVLQSQYGYYISAEKNNKTYQLSGFFQVIAGDDKIIEVNPFLNVGNARVKIVRGYSNEAITNVNVALIPHSRYSGVNYVFQELIAEAYAIGKTNSEGVVEFQSMPADVEYSVLVYSDSNTYDYPTYDNFVYVTRDFKRNVTIRVDL